MHLAINTKLYISGLFTPLPTKKISTVPLSTTNSDLLSTQPLNEAPIGRYRSRDPAKTSLIGWRGSHGYQCCDLIGCCWSCGRGRSMSLVGWPGLRAWNRVNWLLTDVCQIGDYRAPQYHSSTTLLIKCELHLSSCHRYSIIVVIFQTQSIHRMYRIQFINHQSLMSWDRDFNF